MRVATAPVSDPGCRFYRMTEPCRVLVDQGKVVEEIKVTATAIPGKAVQRLVGAIPTDAEVVVIQRPLHQDLLALVKLLQGEGVAVVIEVDDDFAAIPPQHPAWRAYHPFHHHVYEGEALVGYRVDRQRENPRSWKNVERACAIADMVVVPTSALAARYGWHGRVAVLPNMVPQAWLATSVTRDPTVRYVGWTGTLKAHRGDPDVLAGILQPLLTEQDWEFAAVGDGLGVQVALRLDQPPLTSGWVGLGAYPAHLAQFDLGVVPLAQVPFNQAKSWLTGLVMAAVGVPFVATPTAPYQQLYNLGAGVLADKPRDWRNVLRQLMADDQARNELADRGRQVAATLTYEEHAGRWWAAWEQALENRAARGRAA